MVYGVILASGVGRRMNIDIPKQFVEVEGMPIIIYTIKSMLAVHEIDQIYIAVSEVYMTYMQTMLEKYFPAIDIEKMRIVRGGEERIDTIYNVTSALTKSNPVGEDDVVIFHDAVRPFVTKKILIDSIAGAKKYGATVASLPVTDTMLVSEDGKCVTQIPNRSTIFHGQAPDSFRLKYFLELGAALTDEQKKQITGTSQFCTMNNQPIYLVEGSPLNFKITTIEDLQRVKLIVQEERLHEGT